MKPSIVRTPRGHLARAFLVGLAVLLAGCASGKKLGPSIPVSPPNAPTAVMAVPGNAEITVNWEAPPDASDAEITGYAVTGTPGGAATTMGDTSVVVTGLLNGTSYTFTVVAINATGNSPASAASAAVAPSTVPGAPTNVTAVAANGSATITWTAPEMTGGADVTGYTVTSFPAGGTATTTGALTATITGLTDGTSYVFTVHATNADGDSLESSPSNVVTPSTTPDAPSNLNATASAGQALITWSAPADDGGSPITGYVVTGTPSGSATTTGETFAVVAGLTDGTSYTFTVHAINANGDSPESSPSSPVTPGVVALPPDAPADVVVTSGDGQATVTWSAPVTNGSAITSYAVNCSGGASVTTTGNTAVVTGLQNGTSYTCTVSASNAAGTSAASTPSSSFTAGAPDAPTDVTVTSGNGQATVTWSVPATNGSAITSYAVNCSPGGASVMTTGNTAVVTGLQEGTNYTCTVSATNAVGTSAASTPSSFTPGGPGAPTDVSATGGDGEATVTWTAPAPADDGGSAITGYVVTGTPGGTATTTGATSVVVTGLTDGVGYTFTVQAINATGDGPASSPSNPVTPSTPGAAGNVPGPPTDVVATASPTGATVMWSPPDASGGTTITSYTVTSYPGGAQTTTTGALSASMTGLTDGTIYVFTVHATNADGDGPESNPSNTVTIGAAPAPPADVTAVAGNEQATVSWTAPASNGSAISSYTVTPFPEGLPVTTTETSLVVANLQDGMAYTFTVTATNTVGTSAASPPSAPVTPSGPPEVPADVSAIAGNGEVTVSWIAPDDGGSTITGYTVTGTPSGTATTTGATFAVIMGLTNGTAYTFTVHATNANGDSPESLPSAQATPVEQVAAAPFTATATLASDTNGDGVLSPGETGTFAITLINNTTSTATSLTGTITTTTPNVTLTHSTGVSFGTVASGATSQAATDPSGNYPQVAVASSISPGTVIAFQIALTDSDKNAYTATFQYTLQLINQAYTIAAVTITQDNNGAGLLSPGETAAMEISITDTAGSEGIGLTGTLTTSTDGVTLTHAQNLSFGNISGGATSSFGYDASSTLPHMSVATSVAVGTVVTVNLALSDAYGNAFPLSFQYTIQLIDQAYAVATATISGVTNGSGVLSPGESANLQLSIENTGGTEGLGLTGVLTTSTNGVTVTHGNDLTFGTVPGGGTSGNAVDLSRNPPQVAVADFVAVGTVITYALVLTDEFGNSFPLSFQYTIQPIDQAYAMATATISGDTNGDGVLSPGESASLLLSIENTGGSEGLGLTGVLTTTTTGVTVTHGVGLSFGTVPGGSTSPNATDLSRNYPQVAVADSVPVGTVITYALALTDEFGNSFPLTFQYTLQEIGQSYAIYQPMITGDTNGDGVLSPGESAYVDVAILNTGGSEGVGLTGVLATTTAGVTLTHATGLNFRNVAGGAGSSYGYDPSGNLPYVTAASSLPVGTVINFTLTVTDEFGNSFSMPWQYTLQPINQGYVISSVTVTQDTNADGVLSPGETAGLDIVVSNTGGSRGTDITGVLTSSTAGVTLTHSTNLSFGNVYGNSVSGIGTDQARSIPYVTAATTLPVGTVIQFSLALTDAFGNTFALSFQYTLRAINQAYVIDMVTINGDTNGDGVLSPGETCQFLIYLSNTGGTEGLGMTGALTTSTAGITLTHSTALSFGSVVPGDGNSSPGYDGSGYYPYVAVADSVAVGTVIDFSLALTDEFGNAFMVTFTYQLQAINQGYKVSQATIYEDTNRDGILSPGETAALQITLMNTGGSEGLGITGTLTTTTTGVTLANATDISFGSIPGTSVSGYGRDPSENFPHVELADSVPVNTPITFTLALVDEFGNPFATSFTYSPQPIDQVYAMSSVTVDDATGHTTLTPGDNGTLYITLANSGGSEGLDITGTLTTTTSGVTLTHSTDLSFGDVPGLSTSSYGIDPSDNYPHIALSDSVTAGTVIALDLVLVDEFENTFDVTGSITVQ